MGRKKIALERLDVDVVRHAFALQDGTIIRRSVGEIATFRGPGAQLLVRVYHQGHVRRFAAGRIAWAIAVGEWPKGVVKARNGVDDDLRAENLIVVKAGARPFDQSNGGAASSLARRQTRNAALINALADHPGATVPMLSKLVGSSAPCVCTRLGKLADAGLTCGPKCDARARWDLTAQGRALAESNAPPIDDLDKRFLHTLALASLRVTTLKQIVGVCALTVRRRIDALVERGLAREADNRFAITETGRAALGPDAPRPWLDQKHIKAATARDVMARERGWRLDDPNVEAGPERRGRPSRWSGAVVNARLRLSA